MGSGKSILIEEICATVHLNSNEVVVVSTSTEGLTRSLYADITARCVDALRHVGVWYGKRKRMGQVVVTCIPSMKALSAQLKAAGKTCVLWIADEAHRTEAVRVLEAKEALAPVHSLGLTATPFRAKSMESLSLFRKLIGKYEVKEAQADGVIVPMQIENYEGEHDDLDEACIDMIQKYGAGPGLANAVNIADAEAFAKLLCDNGIRARAVHSKMTDRDKTAVMDDLRDGKISVAVHVNILTEGANFPWLCWLLLRREVQSRIRFIQECGRLLRANIDTHGKQRLVWGKIIKRFGLFMDMHDLFGSFDLSYEECLGERPEGEDEDDEIEEELPPEQLAARISEGDPPVAMAYIESAVRALVVACACAKMLWRRKIIKKAQRLKPSNKLQQAAMRSAINSIRNFTPVGWAACLDQIVDRPDCVRFGFASDLIDALTGIRKSEKWPPVDSERRISSMPSADTQPDEDIPTRVDKDGQRVIEFGTLAWMNEL